MARGCNRCCRARADRGSNDFHVPGEGSGARGRGVRRPREAGVDRGEAGGTGVERGGHGALFYDNRVVEIADRLRPSARGTGDHRRESRYLDAGQLFVERFGRGFAWLDTGTPELLLQAANFVETLELRQGLKIACLEEIALYKRFISVEQFCRLADAERNTYGSICGACSAPGWAARPTAGSRQVTSDWERVMVFHEGPIEGLITRPLTRHEDARGWLIELFRCDELPPARRRSWRSSARRFPGVSRAA